MNKEELKIRTNKQRIMPLLKEAKELAAIFVSSRKTARKNSQ
jgi:hypothetical protein